MKILNNRWTGRIILAFFVGGVIWAGVTDKSKPIEPDPCEKARAPSSPINTKLRVVPGTTEQQYIDCARKHDQALVSVDRFMHEQDSYDKPTLDKMVRKPLTEEELLRLTKMSQEQRDNEDCQKFNEYWERLFKKPFEQSKSSDPTSIKFREEALAWCAKFKQR
jgi:hypothetical protein